MQIFRSLGEIPHAFGPAVVSVGNFDGVHRGHRWILERVKERAQSLGARSVAVTFNPHPMCVLRPAHAPRLITPLGVRLELLATTGIDVVVVLPFTLELAMMSAAEFMQNVLRERLGAIEVHEGSNFRFGHRAQAGVDELRQSGRDLGFQVRVYEALRCRGMVISSSNVRSLVAAGNVSKARSLMGRAFFVQSTPAKGRGIGGKLLVPTVNLAKYDELLPAFGVYVTCLRIAGRVFEAVTNVGNRPTFGADSFAVESHILDFPGSRTSGLREAAEPIELQETTQLELTFLARLREEKQWSSPDALRAQIMEDVGKARRYFHLAGAITTAAL